MTGIFYGSTTGNTEAAAQEIASALGVSSDQVYNVGEVGADTVAQFDTLILGSSTWGCGDLQDDWYDFLDQLKAQDLSGKRIALFGCGDSDGYADTFCGALTQIYDALADSGATFVGQVDAAGIAATDTEACRDGKFVGLPIDDADPEGNAARMAAWVESVKA